MGHNVLALAGLMRAHLGVPFRKIASFLAQVFGLPVSAAGIFGALGRLSRALEPTYQGLQLALRQRAVVHSDETGWRLCCESAWLWVFTCPDITVYVIRASRGHKVVVEVLGERFSGWLVTDFLATYNPLDYPHKAKCIPHLLRALSEVETLLGEQPEASFAQEAKSIFKMAIALRQCHDQLSDEAYRGIRSVVHYRLDQLLLRDIVEPHSLRLAKRMRKHRPELLVFLDNEQVPSSNNLAERQIRPGVLQRKISAGNRSEPGAQIHVVLLSVLATAMQRGSQFLAQAVQALKNPGLPVLGLHAPRPP